MLSLKLEMKIEVEEAGGEEDNEWWTQLGRRLSTSLNLNCVHKIKLIV